jgi:hypothetical protein
MIRHDSVRSFCRQNETSRTLRDRVIGIAIFASIGLSLLLGSSLS